MGRGEGSGKGGTSARGHKGAKSRSGYSKRLVLKVVKCHFKDVF
jgi:ribosomal protein L15